MLKFIKTFYWTGYSFENAMNEFKGYKSIKYRCQWFFPFLVEQWQSDYFEILEQLTAYERGYL